MNPNKSEQKDIHGIFSRHCSFNPDTKEWQENDPVFISTINELNYSIHLFIEKHLIPESYDIMTGNVFNMDDLFLFLKMQPLEI